MNPHKQTSVREQVRFTPTRQRVGLTSVREHLERLPREPIYFYQQPGNAGDALIAQATHDLFKELKLDYRPLVPDWPKEAIDIDCTGRIAILAGGGNLNPIYQAAHDLSTILKQIHSHARRVILLPHTIFGLEDLLAELGPNVDLFCRELVSYEHVGKYATGARVFLADDMAFALDARSFLKPHRPLPHPLSYLQLVPRIFWRALSNREKSQQFLSSLEIWQDFQALKTSQHNSTSKARTLNCFRNDAERSDIQLPEDNLDISNQFSYGLYREEIITRSAFRFLEHIDRHDRVRTNRLHVAIGAALLGKFVELYPNNYFKNRAIYEFSLRDRFPKVTWKGA